MHTQKNRLPCRNQSGYSFPALHKTGAGIATPADNYSAQPRQRFFCACRIVTSFSHTNYGGAYGADFGRAGFCSCRWLQPCTSRHPELQPLDGEFSKLATTEATPWQTANNSAPALSVFTSGLKSTADSIGLHLSPSSCSQTYYIGLTAVSLPGITRQSSATWQNCRTLSTSNTTTKQHPEAIPPQYAGGFRTSVTGGSHEER